MISGTVARASLVLMLASTEVSVSAQVIRNGAPAAPIASSVRVPAGAATLYVSGLLADPVNPARPDGDHGDTATQTRSVLAKINAELARNGMGPGDVVMMRVYLAAPPGSARMDFAGMMKAYGEVYGTPSQPNKPARITVQVAALAASWALVEIEVQAARTGAAK